MKQTKIWIGIGAFIVGASNTGIAAADAPSSEIVSTAGWQATTSSPAAITIAQHGNRLEAGGEGEGGERSGARHGGGEAVGEGGEGGEAGARALPPDLDFSLRVALIRGHLLAGHHLVQVKHWDSAHEHFLHPGAELYDGLRAQLKRYDVPPFEERLQVLADIVRQKKAAAEYAAARDEVLEILNSADAAVRNKQDDTAAFALETALEILKVAADEYDAALDGRRVINPVEYQDARAFVLVAREIVEGAAPALKGRDPEALAAVRRSLKRLSDALGAPVPPKQALLDYGALLSEVSRIELAAALLK